MDNTFVILGILLLVFITFIILFAPSPFKHKQKHNHYNEKDQHAKQHVKHEEKNLRSHHINANEEPEQNSCGDPRMQSLNSRKKGAIGDKRDEETLAAFYEPARENVPEDFPVKPIEQCPYSKGQSHDVPLMDIPMCIVDKHNYNMRLNY
jgi:hypothetical protein